jgi:3-oxoadipate enol-lactonase
MMSATAPRVGAPIPGAALLVLLAGCGGSVPPGDAAAPPVREGFAVTPDSVRLWYRVVGSGPETVLVPNALFHGERLDTLATPGRRIVLYDPRGRGRSDSVPAHKVSLSHNLADVETIRQAVGADSVALIGWSGMGMELFVYAVRHPGRVTRLVQFAPVAPRWTPWSDSLFTSRQARTDSAAFARYTARVQAGEFASDPAAQCREQARVTTAASWGDTALASQAPDVCIYPTEWPATIGAYFTAFFPSIEGFDWRPDLSKVTIPRLIVHGELDNTPLAGNQEWAAGQPNARLLVVPGAGHWPHYERPAMVLRALAEFLDGSWPAGSVLVPAFSS